jgi:hypothetical protein
MALQFISQGILERNNNPDGYGSSSGAELNLPYDIGFNGGFNDDMVAEVVTVRTYGQMCMGRAGTFIGCWGRMDSPPSGYTIIDIEKNGTSIYSLTAIARVNITAVGSSYSSVPTVAFSGGGGTGAAATAIVAANAVTSVTITAGGSGYTSHPSVGFTGGGGAGATGNAVLTNGAVTSITITTGGSGYTSVPSVVFTGGGGTGAAGTVVLASNAVTSITMTNTGTGYTSAPTVAFSGGGGTGAAGTAVISVKPNFCSTNDLSNPDALLSVISTTTFGPGDRITFKVITLGQTPGSGMRVTLKCKV